MPISIGTTTVTALFLGTTSITSAYLGNTLVFGGSFTPLSLFSGGSQGIWLDPSDLSTMFSDRAGTTPVTTPGTVVGLRLDKSKGLALGAELVTNGDFAAGTTGWSANATNSTIAVSGGALTLTRTSTNKATAYTSISTVVGRHYKFSGAVTGLTGSMGLLFFSSAISATDPTLFATSSATTVATGAKPFIFVAYATTTYIHLVIDNAGPGGTATIDNISVRELPGNHAVAPTDAARPTYGVEPKGGRRNLLTWSEDFGNAVWTKRGFAAPTTGETDPLGGSTAVSFLENNTDGNPAVFHSTGVSSAASTIGVWLKASSSVSLNLSTNSGTSPGTVSVTTAWQFFSATQSVAGAAGPHIGGFGSVARASGVRIYVWHPQLELGSTATNYQRVTTAYDVTESGVATTHYVQYDGSDDGMSTAPIDFTGTDKVSIFVGIRKSGTQGSILDFGQPTALGFFALWTGRPSTDGPTYHFNSGGNIFVTAEAPLNFPSPMNNLLTCLGDIGGDRATLRINGTQEAQSTANQGTGNYRTYPLYIGRFNGNFAALNGRDYGIVIVGKTASAGEITDTELWLSDKTAEVDVAKSISPNIYTRSGDTILDRANSIIERRTV